LPLDVRRELVHNLVAFVLERRPDRRLAELIPSLGDDTGAIGPTSTRLANVLMTQDVRAWSEIASMSCEQMLAWPNFGSGSLRELLEVAFNHVLEDSGGQEVRTADTHERPHGASAVPRTGGGADAAVPTLSASYPALLGNDGPVISQPMSARLTNSLSRNGVETLGDLADLTAADLRSFRSFGEGQSAELLAFLERLPRVPRVPDPAPTDAGAASTMLDLIAWACGELGASDVSTALDLVIAHSAEIPEELEPAATELLGSSPERLVPDLVRHFDPRRAAEVSLEALTEHEHEVAHRRLLSPSERPSLRALGRELGVSGERVRQIERRAAGKLEDGAAPSLVREAGRIGQALGRMSPVEAFDRARIRSGRSEALTDDTAALLALWLAGPYALDDGWLVREPVGQSRAAAQEAVRSHLKGSGPVVPEELLEVLDAAGVPRAHHAAWLRERATGLRDLDGLIVPWGATMADKAEQVLRVTGRPMTREELALAIGDRTHPRSLGNVLLGDPRFARTTKSSFGLSSWDGHRYSSVADAIQEEIDAHGGAVPLAWLTGELPGRFGISATSVAAYAKGARFAVTGDGMVTTAASSPGLLAGAPPELTPRCYATRDGWAYRTEVDHDLLRGSGSAVPTAIAVLAGLGPDESIELPCGPAPVRLGVNQLRQAWVGSLKPFLDLERAGLGDQVFLELRHGPTPTVALTLVRRDEVDRAPAVPRCLLLSMPDAPGWEESPLAGIVRALAIGWRPVWWGDVRDRLRRRRETELLQLLTDVDDSELLEEGGSGDPPRGEDDVIDELEAIFGASVRRDGRGDG
jgi:hypothetical protein